MVTKKKNFPLCYAQVILFLLGPSLCEFLFGCLESRGNKREGKLRPYMFNYVFYNQLVMGFLIF